MVTLLKDKNMVSSWQMFFEEHYKAEIETIAISYPEKRSIFVDYWTIDRADSELAELLITQPIKAVFNAEEALKLIDVCVEQKLELHFRVVLPFTGYG